MNLLNSIDIFCSIVDNFGDIGVCWRLARQFSVEHGIKVRLFVDDVEAAGVLVPADKSGVELIHWTADISYNQAADMVIEAFACNLPVHVVQQMVLKKSVWIDLEYLSAEDWVSNCHAIPSLHPQTGLEKTLFFPGFDKRTGGLLRERDLIQRRDTFISDENAQNIWRKAHFLPEIDKNFLDISIFYYKTAKFDDLIAGLKGFEREIRLFKPISLLKAGVNIIKIASNIDLYEIPFLRQFDYDYLLWTCDMNFVRGEDSFVRAQWSAKPFIWNIYVQDNNAHYDKLHAFLDKNRPFYDAESFERLAHCHELWNEGGQIEYQRPGSAWKDFLQSLTGLSSGAKNWCDSLLLQEDLARQLVNFAKNQLAKE